jgi:hypothetical protein
VSEEEQADRRSAVLTMRIADVCLESTIDFLGGSDALSRMRRELEDLVEEQLRKLEGRTVR